MKLEKKQIFGLLSVLLFIGFTLWVTLTVGKPMIEFVEDPKLFREWVDTYGIFGRIIFVGMVVFQVVIALIPENRWNSVLVMHLGHLKEQYLQLSEF